jgi:hypothetical protein
MRKLAMIAAMAASFVAMTAAQVDVVTNRYDGARSGANLGETSLTTANVNASRFGRLHSYPVDGAVYAQPLYVRGVVVGGIARNLLYVATMNDKVYAFDADSTSPTPVWMQDFTRPPTVVAVPITDIGTSGNIVGTVGIQSTPVIDLSSGTIYLLARTRESGDYVQQLHALDITTGRPRSGSPVTIAASVPGTAPDAAAGTGGTFITFDPKVHVQRAGLALTNGVVLVSWASHEDITPSHGWIMGFDATTLARVGTFVATPDSYNGGIWQGGRAPTIDSDGNAYFATGNGKFDGVRSFGDTLLKLRVSRSGLTLLDYFTPGNESALSDGDDDLSGSGFTLLPGTNLLLGGGKEGVLYLLDAHNLGHKVAGDTQIVQRIGVSGGHVMGGAVFWKSAAGSLVYNWSEDDVLKAYSLVGGRLAATPYAQGNVRSPGHPGGSLTISANGSAAGTGIVWASMPTSRDGISGLVAGVLRAFDATTLTELWSSERNPARDRAGTLIKFVPPVVANGRVYLPTHDNAVAVYGLLPKAPPTGTGSIGINFVGGSSTIAMGATEVAGVVPMSHWNNAAGATRSTALPLVDDNGAATAATATWTANSTWGLPTADSPGNARLMRGYLDTTNSSTTTVHVAGLVKRAYDIYVYADGANSSYTRTGAYVISGPGLTTTSVSLTDASNVNYSSAYTRGNNSTGNYVTFTITAAEFTLTATPTAPVSATRRAPINAVQIVPATAAPALATFSLDPTSIVGGCGTTSARVTLDGIAPPGGRIVTFSEAIAAASFPASITIAAGQTSASFNVPALYTSTSQTGVITASSGGSTATQTLTVRAIRGASLSLSPGAVTGGTMVTGTVTLECATSDPVVVSLSSSDPAKAVPLVSSIVIPARATTGAFSINTMSVAAASTVSIDATVNGDRVSAPLSVISGTASLPSGWQSRDIGAVGMAGSATESGGTFTVKGGGADIWTTVDGFHYAYRSLAGDGVITARVATIHGTQAWTKVGVMIRGTTDPSSAHALMLVSSGKGVAFQRRAAGGGLSTSTSGGSGVAPRWVRLTRVGNLLTASTSPDGSSWTIVGSDTVSLPANALVGLVSHSHDPAMLATATFTDVTVASGGVLPAGWQSQDIGATGIAGRAYEGGGRFVITGAGADIWGRPTRFTTPINPSPATPRLPRASMRFRVARRGPRSA